MELLKTLARRKKYLVWAMILVVAVVLLRMTVFAPPKVKVVSLEKRDLTAKVYGNGTIEAKVVVGISSKITGRIVELYADQGDRVKKGQLLAALENTDFVNQFHQARANVNKASASRELEAANLRKAEANLVLAEKNARRCQNLLKKDLVSRLEAEQYETSYLVAKEEVNRSRAALAETGMEETAGRANQRFTRARLDDTFIYAPEDGIIISRDLEKGAVVTPGLNIFSLTEPQTVWVKANVDESLMEGVAVGKKAFITLRSAPGKQFEGRVSRVGRESDRVTEESEVDVAFMPALGNFRLGEQSDVYIVTEVKKGVPSLPSGVIVTKGKKKGVWVVDNGRLKLKEIKTGIADWRGFTEVTSGLDGSERVVSAFPQEMGKFSNGMKVRAR